MGDIQDFNSALEEATQALFDLADSARESGGESRKAAGEAGAAKAGPGGMGAGKALAAVTGAYFGREVLDAAGLAAAGQGNFADEIHRSIYATVAKTPFFGPFMGAQDPTQIADRVEASLMQQTGDIARYAGPEAARDVRRTLTPLVEEWEKNYQTAMRQTHREVSARFGEVAKDTKMDRTFERLADVIEELANFLGTDLSRDTARVP